MQKPLYCITSAAKHLTSYIIYHICTSTEHKWPNTVSSFFGYSSPFGWPTQTILVTCCKHEVNEGINKRRNSQSWMRNSSISPMIQRQTEQNPRWEVQSISYYVWLHCGRLICAAGFRCKPMTVFATVKEKDGVRGEEGDRVKREKQ